MDDRRVAFEAWITKFYMTSYGQPASLSMRGEYYDNYNVQNMYCAWQSSREAALEDAAAKCEDIKLMDMGTYDAAVWECGTFDAAIAIRALKSAPAVESVEVMHVCGMSGYNPMIDDPCPGCVSRRSSQGSGK